MPSLRLSRHLPPLPPFLLLPRHVPRLPRLRVGLRLRLQLLVRLTSLRRCGGCHVSPLSVCYVSRAGRRVPPLWRKRDAHRFWPRPLVRVTDDEDSAATSV